MRCCRLCPVSESELLDRIKKNKVSKALFLIQKALLEYNSMEPNNSNNQTKNLLEVRNHSHSLRHSLNYVYNAKILIYLPLLTDIQTVFPHAPHLSANVYMYCIFV